MVLTVFAMKVKLLINRTCKSLIELFSGLGKEKRILILRRVKYGVKSRAALACVRQYFHPASLTLPSACSIIVMFFRTTEFKISHSATLTKISFSTMNWILSCLYAAIYNCLRKRARILLGDRFSLFTHFFIYFLPYLERAFRTEYYERIY